MKPQPPQPAPPPPNRILMDHNHQETEYSKNLHREYERDMVGFYRKTPEEQEALRRKYS